MVEQDSGWVEETGNGTTVHTGSCSLQQQQPHLLSLDLTSEMTGAGQVIIAGLEATGGRGGLPFLSRSSQFPPPYSVHFFGMAVPIEGGRIGLSCKLHIHMEYKK